MANCFFPCAFDRLGRQHRESAFIGFESPHLEIAPQEALMRAATNLVGLKPGKKLREPLVETCL